MKSSKRSATRDLYMVGGETLQMDEYLHRRHVQAGTSDYPSRENDDFPVDYPDGPKTLAASKQLGLFNTLRLYANPTPGRLAACERDRHFFLLDIFRVRHDYDRPEFRERFADLDAYAETYYKEILGVLAEYPDTSWGTVTGEADTCCVWPKTCFRTREEAYAYWKERFFSCDSLAYLAKHGLDYRRLNLSVQCGMLWSIHHYFDWGFRFVWLERGCGLSNVQLGAAFLRGASRQYGGGLWGFDFSTHHPHRNQCTWYDQEGRRRGGWSESLMLRSWMTGFLAGANLVFEETSNFTHWIFDEQGGFRPSPAGELAKRFADFSLRNHPERGEPHAPVGLVLNFRHGYDARHSILLRQPVIWGGRMPLGPEDWNLANLFELFFPGHNQSWGLFDEAFNPDVPWKSQWEYLDMLKNGHDMRPYEAGHLVNGALGDCLDVLVDTADGKALARYPVLMLGGLPDFSGERAGLLTEYLEQGGTLIASFDQLPREVREAAGVGEGRTDWDYDLTTCADGGQTFGGDRYWFRQLTVPRGQVLGYNHANVPLAWEIPCGKGLLVLTAAPFSQDISGRRILPLYAHLFEKYIRRELLVCAGPEPLQLTVNRGDGFLVVGAFNNAATPWQGSIAIQARAGREVASVEDIWNGKPVVTDIHSTPFSFTDSIAPFDFKVYRIGIR